MKSSREVKKEKREERLEDVRYCMRLWNNLTDFWKGIIGSISIILIITFCILLIMLLVKISTFI